MKQIVFTKKDTAECLDVPEKPMEPGMVMVRTAVSTVSCGTERANITGDRNVNGASTAPVTFPRVLGYSSAGEVVAVGENVTSVKKGDRVVVFWGTHSEYNIVNEDQVVKIEDERISYEEAAISFIATFPLAAVRKTRVEAGESMLVMGLGILGQLAVQLARASGAVPVIACDPVASRREMALKFGADAAFDPLEVGFAERLINECGRVQTCIEVTGRGEGLNESLDVMARFGRVALLGCTRDKNFTVDYYRKVHFPGIELIGAHTMARPDRESRPGCFTHPDDIRAVLKLCAGGRIDLRGMICETHKPEECGEVYARLVSDRDFPVVVQFDWRTKNA